MDEIEITRTATRMIEMHGDKAVRAAAMRMVLLRAEGDLDGAFVWARILAAISKLSPQKPSASEPTN